MANCERKNELKIYLGDKEPYILEQMGMSMTLTTPICEITTPHWENQR